MLVFAFVSGSLPFSVWLGKLFLGLDVRRFGDGNPGSANVVRAGSKPLAVLILVLDVCKAAVPVGLSYVNLDIRGLPMLLIAVAPILGHAFSPFLRFRGGKALATALGVWIGLTLWKASLPAVLGVALGIGLFTSAGWAVMFALACILLALLAWMPSPLLLGVWLLQTLILAWTHRADLRRAPRVRAWLAKRLRHARGRA
jgi:glycerol-3-phosphate acyltransferase PlsY